LFNIAFNKLTTARQIVTPKYYTDFGALTLDTNEIEDNTRNAAFVDMKTKTGETYSRAKEQVPLSFALDHGLS
jgi:hypothetical protein